MLNWPGAMLLIACEAIACFACYCDPKATAPGGPTLLLIVTTGLNLAILIGFYRQDRTEDLKRRIRSAIDAELARPATQDWTCSCGKVKVKADAPRES